MSTTKVESEPKSFLDGVKDFEGSRRVILASLVAIVAYFIFGAFVYSTWLDDQGFIDALYFSAVTASTVGYGDVLPVTDGQKVFTIFFILLGVVFVLGVALTLLVDDLYDAVNRAKKSAREVGELHLVEKFMKRHTKKKIRLPANISGISAYGRVMLKNGIYITACFIPPIIFAFVEGWNVVETIYYSVVTFTTVGYGDISPSNKWVRLAAVFYVPVSVVIFSRIFSSLSNVYMTRKTKEAERAFLNRKLTKEDIRAMDVDFDGKVTKEEYLMFMLVIMGKVDSIFINKLRSVFDKLDTDRSGTLTVEDLLKIHNDDDETVEDDGYSVEAEQVAPAPASYSRNTKYVSRNKTSPYSQDMLSDTEMWA